MARDVFLCKIKRINRKYKNIHEINFSVTLIYNMINYIMYNRGGRFFFPGTWVLSASFCKLATQTGKKQNNCYLSKLNI